MLVTPSWLQASLEEGYPADERLHTVKEQLASAR